LLTYAINTLFVGAVGALTGPAQLAALAPGKLGVYLRRAFYRQVLLHVGSDVFIGFGTLLTSPRSRLGANAYIGPYCVLGEVIVEDDVLIASCVSIINGGMQHGIDEVDIPIREQQGRLEPVSIGAGSWIGERAVVMASLGRGCVVGAGSVVTRSIPDQAVAAGVPARVMRYRGPHWPEAAHTSAYLAATARD
jgi:acetyltransferase-like isoleucine patch superfamily enzyme